MENLSEESRRLVRAGEDIKGYWLRSCLPEMNLGRDGCARYAQALRGCECREGDPLRNQGGTARYSPLTDFVGQGRFCFFDKTAHFARLAKRYNSYESERYHEVRI